MSIGVCIIAHGSRSSDWVRLVDTAVREADLPCLYTICFLEMVPGRTMSAGLAWLQGQGVERIIVVPLFVSSGSTRIAEIRQLIVREGGTLPLSFCGPMDNHLLIRQLLWARAQEISTSSQTEALLFVGHGSDVDGFSDRWQSQLQTLQELFSARGDWAEVGWATLHPDTLEEQAARLGASWRLLVVPLFLAEGYFTQQVIPAVLTGLADYRLGRTYLPGSQVAQWIRQVVQTEFETMVDGVDL